MLVTNGDLQQMAFSESFIERNIVNSCLATHSLVQKKIEVDEPTKGKIAKDVSHYSKFILSNLCQAASNNETSSVCSIKLLAKENYHFREDVMRAIFASVFNVKIEESETSKSTRDGSSSRLWGYYDPEVTLKLCWRSEDCGPISNLLGEKTLRSALTTSSRDAQLNQFRIGGKMCDCRFLVGEMLFHAHQTVLASRSPYFETFFNGYCAGPNEVIAFSDTGLSPEVFGAFLDYIYTQQTQLSTSDVPSLLQFLELAHTTGVSSLMLLCQKHLMKQLDWENFYLIFRATLTLGDDAPLCKDCRRFAKKYAKEIDEVKVLHFQPYELLECIQIGRRLESPELEKVALAAISAVLDHTNFTFFCWAAKDGKLDNVKELCRAFISNNSWILEKLENKEERVAYITLMTDVPFMWDCFVG